MAWTKSWIRSKLASRPDYERASLREIISHWVRNSFSRQRTNELGDNYSEWERENENIKDDKLGMWKEWSAPARRSSSQWTLFCIPNLCPSIQKQRKSDRPQIIVLNETTRAHTIIIRIQSGRPAVDQLVDSVFVEDAIISAWKPHSYSSSTPKWAFTFETNKLELWPKDGDCCVVSKLGKSTEMQIPQSLAFSIALRNEAQLVPSIHSFVLS